MVRRIVSWSVARERLAPILMMARTTGLALVPLVFVSADRERRVSKEEIVWPERWYTRTFASLVAAALVGLASSACAEDDESPGKAGRFGAAGIRFEQNATDGDVEVVFHAIGGAAGLTHLSVQGPDGRNVAEFNADAATLGLRSFILESPEPRDVEALKAAYPEGMYSFSALSLRGVELRGKYRLVHALPPTTKLLEPEPEATDVNPKALSIRWQGVDGVVGYKLEIEQDDLGIKLEVRLPASSTSFTVPEELLHPGTEYDIGVGTVSETGNISFIETSFTTRE